MTFTVYICIYCDHKTQASFFERITECEICGDKNLKKQTFEHTNVFGYNEEGSNDYE